MGDPLSISPESYRNLDDLLNLAESAFTALPDKGDVTSWMDLIRTCRQPQIMWEVDYIEPKKQLLRINELIIESEKLLFKDSKSTELKNQYSADIDQLEAFNTIRVHLKAENGDFESATTILEHMLTNAYDDLSLIRKSNLLYHGCLVFLCCKNLEISYHCMEKHWALLKYADVTERVQLGLWDNQVLLQMAYWFFVKYSVDVREFYSIKTKTPISDIWNHKKIAALYFLEYDNSWIASFCGLPFYEHARSLYPNLPKYEKKRSTPCNIDKTWEDDTYRNDGSKAVGEEKYYYEQFNREHYYEQFNKEVNTDIHYVDPDKASDYLYSYYHYQTNYTHDANSKVPLIEFMNKNITIEVSSVLEVGTGIEIPRSFAHTDYLGLNISTKVCSILRDKGIPHKHRCASLLLKDIDKHFDLCLAYDFLNHLTSTRLRIFIEECSKKCTYLLTAVDTRNDYRTDILSKRQPISRINLHPTIMNLEEWRNYLTPNFECRYESPNDSWIYIFGKSKYGLSSSK